jgi:hypothetical protein
LKLCSLQNSIDWIPSGRCKVSTSSEFFT